MQILLHQIKQNNTGKMAPFAVWQTEPVLFYVWQRRPYGCLFEYTLFIGDAVVSSDTSSDLPA
jgi:hypothetical protein